MHEASGALVGHQDADHARRPVDRVHRRHRQGAPPGRRRARRRCATSCTAPPPPPTPSSRARARPPACSPPRASATCSRSAATTSRAAATFRLGEADAPGPARAHLRGRRRASTVDGPCSTPLDEAAGRAAARQLRPARRGRRSRSCSCTLRQPRARAAHAARSWPRSIPAALVSLSTEVLPVFREFERIDGAPCSTPTCMPLVSRYVGRAARAAREAGRAARRCSIMKSNGGVISAPTSCGPGDAHRALRPRRRRDRRASRRRGGRLRRPDLHRRGRHQRRHLPRPRRRSRDHQGGPHRHLPAQAAHARHPHDRRRRRLHRARHRRRAAHGGAASAGAEPGPVVLWRAAARSRP